MAWAAYVLGVNSIGMAYVYFGVLMLPRGLTRLLAILPLIAFYVYMPVRFYTVFERGVFSFFFTWLTSFKLTLLCWDAGPAADPWAIASFPRFMAVMNLSLHLKREKFSERKKKYSITKPRTMPKDVDDSVVVTHERKSSVARRHDHANSNGKVLENGDEHIQDAGNQKARNDWKGFLTSFNDSLEWHIVILRLVCKFLFLGLICFSYVYSESIPPGLIYFIYSWHMYICCSLMFEGLAAVVSPVLGIELEAAYDKPFLAHSLSNFWGKRWNLLISDLLRVSVYDPMLYFFLRIGGQSATRDSGLKASNGVHNSSTESVNGSAMAHKQLGGELTPLFLKPPLWARSISMFSCFLVSGLMHEIIFYYMNLSNPTWEGTAFFVISGAATTLELAVRRKTSLRLPNIISIFLTLSFLYVTAVWLFFPALCGPGTDVKAIAEFQYFFQKVNSWVAGSYRSAELDIQQS